MDLAQRLEIVEAENDALRARIYDMERLFMATDVPLPIEWGLTGQEARVFGVLLSKDLATKPMIHFALYSDRPWADEAYPKIVDVFIHKIRKKLRPWEIEITTRWGSGYSLDAKTRARLLVERRAA